jgi:hypothetical protein
VHTVSVPLERDRVLASVASALAATDPDRAEDIATTITNMNLKERAWAGIARALAASGLDRALAVTRNCFGSDKGYALAGIARTIAHVDPDQAEYLAATITRRRMAAHRTGALGAGVAHSVLDKTCGHVVRTAAARRLHLRTLPGVLGHGRATVRAIVRPQGDARGSSTGSRTSAPLAEDRDDPLVAPILRCLVL